jgi:putative addiction module component (TIGR02574 family)
MPENTSVIFESAMQLSEEERLSLVSRLLDTLPEHAVTVSLDDSDFLDELDRRFAQPEGAIPWAELRAEG